VRHLGPKEIGDIFAVRAALEATAAAALTQRTDRAEVIAELRSLLHTMSEARADVDLEGRIEADLNFHRGLCRLSGNDTLLHTWESLEGSMRMSIMFAGRERAIRNMNVARHKAIVDAIASGDAAAAAAAVHEHMGSAADNLVH
jgi:DNA-binding GntR family transcriptional regulator